MQTTSSHPYRTIIAIWFGWLLAVIGFQFLATARLQPQWPDYAQFWTIAATAPEAKPGYQVGHKYLTEPFMNNQVAWDSEYYLGIAVGGYNDPQIPALVGGVFGSPGSFDYHHPPQSFTKEETVSLSYAFFPFYPMVTRVFIVPLSLLGMNQVATATLAAVIVSALGALMGMLALYELTRDSLGEEGALRAAFYLLIFPTGFFMAQVYTEGLFVGLAFGSLAFLKRGNWFMAAMLAGFATLTRAVGVALVIPMAITWIRTREWYWLDLEWRQIFLNKGFPAMPFVRAICAFTPLIVFLFWKFSYWGLAFDYVEGNYFGRGYLDIGQAVFMWKEAIQSMFMGLTSETVVRIAGASYFNEYLHRQHSAYYLTEFIGLIIGLTTIWSVRKSHPELAWFSFAVFIISWGSGPLQGIQRYILGAPAVFVGLATWGRNPVFDRIWTIVSILLMGLLAMIYAFNMWVA